MNGSKTVTTGLGKGLAGILGETRDVAPTTGVTDLLRSVRVRRSPAVREMVTQMAISSIATAFDTDGVVIARRDSDDHFATVASQVPSSWTGLDPLMFEVVGQLWGQLESGHDGQLQRQLGGYEFLLCRQTSQDGPMAAAVVRKQPFSESEAKTVGRLVRSVGSALSDSILVPADSAINVAAQRGDGGYVAEVRLGSQEGGRHGAAAGESAAASIAAAAVKICVVGLEVQFVGQATVDAKLVTMVVLTDNTGGPLFGLAVTDSQSCVGPAEAVFGAARVVGGDPFSVSSAAISS